MPISERSNPIPLENIFGKEFLEETERIHAAIRQNISDLTEMGYLDAEANKVPNRNTKSNNTVDKEEIECVNCLID